MASVTASGIGSGLDINSIVSQLVAAERSPVETRLNSKESLIQARLSAFGSLKSSLTNFQSSLSTLKNADTFSKHTTTVSDSTIFSASSTTSASAGSYSVQVEQLASGHKIASQAYADSDTSVGSGELTVSVNGEAFSITLAEGEDSLIAIRDAINSAEDNSGVSASIVNDQDGAHLVFSATETGVENAINISVVNGASGNLSQLAFDTGLENQLSSMVEKTEALDSIVIVDGFTQTSSTNKVDDMIEGVSFNLLKASPGDVFSLNITQDTGVVKKAVESFVKNYNSLMTTINDLTAYDPEANTAGLLQGDSAMRSVANRLRQEMGTIVGGLGSELASLAEIGVTTGDKGKLVIDSSKLDDIIDSDFEDLSGIFSGENGYATRLDTLIGDLTSSNGVLANRTDGLSSQVDRIASQREALDLRIASIEARYQAQFSALDSLLGQLNATGDFLSQQLANLPGSVYKDS
ncbi:flagellar filament capping protein FliD [Zhongshania aliphaticivorans]|uniref:flagellar filament capping protein FliD n=1 Tax=Zhongshania aliphaticivorans TaxID=1470434 RepID=UPI0012E53BE1|nr:flagellar filament capping protein FliD [Zhongshania aliphaticivorans]CAA0099850.1 B-type flagellar hook-associated protein 2 [Zhongshania aliphaticivorans]